MAGAAAAERAIVSRHAQREARGAVLRVERAQVGDALDRLVEEQA